MEVFGFQVRQGRTETKSFLRKFREENKTKIVKCYERPKKIPAYRHSEFPPSGKKWLWGAYCVFITVGETQCRDFPISILLISYPQIESNWPSESKIAATW